MATHPKDFDWSKMKADLNDYTFQKSFMNEWVTVPDPRTREQSFQNMIRGQRELHVRFGLQERELLNIFVEGFKSMKPVGPYQGKFWLVTEIHEKVTTDCVFEFTLVETKQYTKTDFNPYLANL